MLDLKSNLKLFEKSIENRRIGIKNFGNTESGERSVTGLLGDSVPNYIRKRRENPYEIRKYPGGDTCM